MKNKKRLDKLVADCLFEITQAYVNKGVPSIFNSNQKVVTLTKNLQFNADGNRFYVEVGPVLYDNEGYHYSVTNLGTENLVAIADYCNTL